MTYNTKNTAIVFAFAALLLAWPVAISQANAESGDGEIDAACGVTIPTNIDLGDITPNADNGEFKVAFDTTGSIAGTFEMEFDTDFVGDGSKATASLIIPQTPTGTTVTINEHVFVGTDGSSGAGEFDSTTGTLADVATDLAASINTSTQLVTENFGTSIEVTAFATDNVVLLTAVTRGTGPNGVLNVETTDAAEVTVVTDTDSGFMEEGVAAATHINAEDLRFEIQTGGEGAPSSTYASKTAFAATGTNTVMTTETDVVETVDVYFHFTGIDTAATGSVEVLAGITDGESVTIGGTEFTGRTSSPDATANEFLVTGTPGTDAVALKAAIDAVPNTPDATTGTIAGGTIPLEASRAGTVGNGLTFTQNADGFTLVVFSGGDDAIEALPYDGPLAATITFTADCDV